MATKKPYLNDDQLEEIQAIQASRYQEENVAQDRNQFNLPLANYNDTPDFAEELIFSWVSPERTFRPRLSKDYLRNLILILILIVLLLVFTSQFYLLVVVLALIFLFYALANVPPKKIRHAITNYGLYTHDHFYSWLDRGKRFWFEENYHQSQVVVETQLFPYRLVMLVGHNRNKPHLQAALSHYLLLQKPAPTQIDKIVAWWQKRFPLE